MKNHPLINPITNKEEWISRAIASFAIVLGTHDSNKYVLAVTRGEGTPDPEFIGKWCLPCGYLDFDETIKQSISREVFEETGMNINPDNWECIYMNDEPSADKRQNVVFGFKTVIEDIDAWELSDIASEPDEVSDIQWIPVEEIDNLEWAFNHKEILGILV